MKCEVCGKELTQRVFGHYSRMNDENHKRILNQQVEIIKNSFDNLDVNKNAELKNFGIIFTYGNCLDIWQETFGKEKCKERANKLNGKGVSKALKGKPLTDNHKKALSESHIGQTPWNIGLNTNNSEKIRQAQDKRNKTMSRILKEKYKNGEMKAWLKNKSKETSPKLKEMYGKVSKTMAGKEQITSKGISGIRKDIGHFAASTYEANIYRILQYHNSDYLKEHEIIKEIKYPNGEIKDYRIDILDVDGILGVKGAYLEVKGFLKDRDKMKVELFRQQYPDDILLLVGYGDKRDEYFWEPDIDYAELERKYRPLIPLWEDRKQNLKTHPELYKMD